MDAEITCQTSAAERIQKTEGGIAAQRQAADKGLLLSLKVLWPISSHGSEEAQLLCPAHGMRKAHEDFPGGNLCPKSR